MKTVKVDPLQAAMEWSSSEEARGKWSFARDLGSHYRHVEGCWEAEREKVWKPVRREVRRVFRSVFRAKVWTGLSVDFEGRGYGMNHADLSMYAYERVWLSWHGLSIRREFRADSLGAVRAEALRIRAVLEAWSASKGVDKL